MKKEDFDIIEGKFINLRNEIDTLVRDLADLYLGEKLDNGQYKSNLSYPVRQLLCNIRIDLSDFYHDINIYMNQLQDLETQYRMSGELENE